MYELKRMTAILVTGTPGAGKTAVSRLLAKAVQARYVSLAALVERREIDYMYDRHRRTRVVSLKMVGSSLSSLAMRSERGLVIDSHLTFELVPPLRLERTFVLRCYPPVLEQRLERKHWSKRKIRENLLAEILDICLWDAVHEYGWKKIFEIDTTNKRSIRVVQSAVRALERKRIQKSIRVHWLSRLRRNRLLTRYLA